MVATSPGAGAEVPRRASFEIFFDRLLAPITINRSIVRVVSGSSRPFLAVRFDPVRRRLIAARFSGGPLEPNVRYRVELDPVQDLEGRASEPFSLTFFTSDEEGVRYEEPVATFAEVEPIFTSCASAGCHGGSGPALGLDLSSAESIQRTAVGQSARQTGDRDFLSSRGLAGFPLVDVVAGGGRPSTSYLLYKMIGDSHVVGHNGESAREEAEAVSRWILAGAPSE